MPRKRKVGRPKGKKNKTVKSRRTSKRGRPKNAKPTYYVTRYFRGSRSYQGKTSIKN